MMRCDVSTSRHCNWYDASTCASSHVPWLSQGQAEAGCAACSMRRSLQHLLLPLARTLSSHCCAGSAHLHAVQLDQMSPQWDELVADHILHTHYRRGGAGSAGGAGGRPSGARQRHHAAAAPEVEAQVGFA